MLHRENKIPVFHQTSAYDLVKEVMDYYDITQKDLADRIGVSQKNISDILNRKRYLTPTLALRIEKVMGISSELLLNLDADYKLNLAKTEDKFEKIDNPTPTFLQKYSWVSNS